MRILNNENGISELVGAMMILLILVVYLGVLQAYEVPKWNRDIEKQQFDETYGDFENLRGDLGDAYARNIPKTSSLEVGVRYPERFMLQNPGQGAYGVVTTYPLNINVSYVRSTGALEWKNYSSIGIIYEMKGISDNPKLVYENGILIKDFGNVNISMDENQSLVTYENIFIPVLKGRSDSVSTMEAKTFEIQPLYRATSNGIRFSTLNASIETRYPDVWKKFSSPSIPSGSNFAIENNSNCPSGKSSCIKITGIPGYLLKRINLPDNATTWSRDNQIGVGMIRLDDSMAGTRGPTGPDGQDMWEKNQGRLDIPAAANATQFIIQDITMGRAASHHHEEDEEEESTAKLKFSVTDTNNHLWTIEIKLRQSLNGSILVDYVKQKYPKSAYNTSLNVAYGKYNAFTYSNITLSREVDLTPYYRALSNIGVPNVLTIDQMDSKILYVNFVIN